MTEKIIPEANVLYQGKTITGNTLDRSKNLIWNFMNAVSQHPDAIAIEGDGTWTYAMFRAIMSAYTVHQLHEQLH